MSRANATPAMMCMTPKRPITSAAGRQGRVGRNGPICDAKAASAHQTEASQTPIQKQPGFGRGPAALARTLSFVKMSAGLSPTMSLSDATASLGLEPPCGGEGQAARDSSFRRRLCEGINGHWHTLHDTVRRTPSSDRVDSPRSLSDGARLRRDGAKVRFSRTHHCSSERS